MTPVRLCATFLAVLLMAAPMTAEAEPPAAVDKPVAIEAVQVETESSEPVCKPTYILTDTERSLAESVVMAEAGGEPFDGQMAVAQCILNACLLDGIRPAEAVVTYRYAKSRPEPSESVREAVSAVFDMGETVTDEAILWFYAPARCTSKFHESLEFVMGIGGHRFFK